MNLAYSQQETTSQLASVVAYKKYGIPRTSIDYIARTHSSIKPDVRDCFKTYFLIYWSSEYVREKITQAQLDYKGKIYNVIYKGITPREIQLLTENIQISLSFREAQDEYKLPAYVIIKRGNV